MAKKKSSQRYSDFSPTLVRRLWTGFALLLLATLLVGLFSHLHPSFAVESTPFFHAWFGLFSCFAIIILSKLLGVWLKRPEDYYDAKR